VTFLKRNVVALVFSCSDKHVNCEQRLCQRWICDGLLIWWIPGWRCWWRWYSDINLYWI